LCDKNKLSISVDEVSILIVPVWSEIPITFDDCMRSTPEILSKFLFTIRICAVLARPNVMSNMKYS
jgi:hypothetical protein